MKSVIVDLQYYRIRYSKMGRKILGTFQATCDTGMKKKKSSNKQIQDGATDDDDDDDFEE